MYISNIWGALSTLDIPCTRSKDGKTSSQGGSDIRGRQQSTQQKEVGSFELSATALLQVPGLATLLTHGGRATLLAVGIA